VLRAADQWSVEPATVEEVLEAQDWARDRAQGALKAHAGAAQEVIATR
jgi:1-deoxy-D-xylulose-5-phosphate reductoisomerase